VDFDINVYEFVDKAKRDGASIILHERRNWEVAASFVGFKTNDQFASCFIDYWVSLAPTYRANFDNGDLLQAVLDISAPDLAKKCNPLRTPYGEFMTKCQKRHPGESGRHSCSGEFWNEYNNAFVPCFAKVYARYVDAVDKGQSGTGPHGVPIRIFMAMEGMWRSFEGENESERGSGFFNLLEGNLFVHGYKEMGRYFSSDENYKCDKHDNIHRLGKKEVWFSPEETLKLAQKYCFHRYTKCFHDGKNICKDNCSNDIALSGAGIR
jgi:hypothetical protein